MNKLRRKEIFKIIQKINKILSNLKYDYIDKLVELIYDIIDEIQYILDEEEFAMDNTPENLQNTQRYEVSELACENLFDSIEELEEIDEDFSKEEIEHCLLNVIRNLNNCI